MTRNVAPAIARRASQAAPGGTVFDAAEVDGILDALADVLPQTRMPVHSLLAPDADLPPFDDRYLRIVEDAADTADPRDSEALAQVVADVLGVAARDGSEPLVLHLVVTSNGKPSVPPKPPREARERMRRMIHSDFTRYHAVAPMLRPAYIVEA